MDEKRLEILERATAVYMKYGIKSVTMDDLARELAMSKKTIYKYFEDKNDLVKSIMEMKIQMEEAICVNCCQQAENAIDDLVQISEIVVQHIGNINPTVFYDLKKYHPEAWQILDNHKWKFVLSTIQSNLERGIEEGLYRKNMNIDIISRLYVASIDTLFDGHIFPWPQFKFQEIYRELIRLHIKGFVNENGLKYLKQNVKNEEF